MKNHFVKAPIPFLKDARFFKAGDGLLLRWHLDFPALWKKGDPLLLLLPGRAESLDKYDRVTAFFLEKGLAVFRMDWRGQGGSGRLLPQSSKGHIDDFATYISDLEEIVTHEVLPLEPGKKVFFGHSMGGHLLLRYLLGGGEMDAAILVSPMLSIHTGILSESFAWFVIQSVMRLGLSENKVPGRKWLDKRPRFGWNRLTRDPEHFYRFQKFLAEHPSLKTEEPTWAWVYEAFRSIEKLWKDLTDTPVEIPVLVFSGGRDRVVDPHDHSKLMQFLKKGTFHFFPGAYHELMMEKEDVLQEAWRIIEEFLKRHHVLDDKTGRFADDESKNC